MTAYKRNLLAWTAIMATGLGAIALSVYHSPWFVVPLAGVAYGGHRLLRSVVCPNCGAAVSFEGDKSRTRFRPPGVLLRTHCATCSFDLDRPKGAGRGPD